MMVKNDAPQKQLKFLFRGRFLLPNGMIILLLKVDLIYMKVKVTQTGGKPPFGAFSSQAM